MEESKFHEIIETKKPSPPLSKDEMEEFESFYQVILEDLIKLNDEEMMDMEITTDWMVQVMKYNVCGGKKLRGLMVPVSYKNLVKEVDPRKMKKAYLVGWIIEMFQGASLIADDIMDQSETRRGKLCWYKRKDVGMMAVNDCFLLENLAYRLLRHYFDDDASEYLEIHECLQQVVIKSILGQGLDCMTGNADNILDSFTVARYNAIVKYKTSYYTMFLPVACGMILAGKGKNKEAMKKVEDILLEIGHYFQVQDDYLDCFGDSEITGKVGTDIQDNKCTWLFVQAVEKCNPEELQYLLDNYGSKDPKKIENVKNLYRNLELQALFADYETGTQAKIAAKMKELPKEVGDNVFRQLFMMIYKRTK